MTEPAARPEPAATPSKRTLAYTNDRDSRSATRNYAAIAIKSIGLLSLLWAVLTWTSAIVLGIENSWYLITNLGGPFGNNMIVQSVLIFPVLEAVPYLLLGVIALLFGDRLAGWIMPRAPR